MNKALPLLGAAAILLLAGCSSTRGRGPELWADRTARRGADRSVSTTALPPIGPNGEVQGPAPLTPDPMGDPTPGWTRPVFRGASRLLPDTGLASTGRDLSGGLTVEKLLGRWTVVSGADQCQLNLTQTAKTGTGRYRASAPACSLKGLERRRQLDAGRLAGAAVRRERRPRRGADPFGQPLRRHARRRHRHLDGGLRPRPPETTSADASWSRQGFGRARRLANPPAAPPPSPSSSRSGALTADPLQAQAAAELDRIAARPCAARQAVRQAPSPCAAPISSARSGAARPC